MSCGTTGVQTEKRMAQAAECPGATGNGGNNVLPAGQCRTCGWPLNMRSECLNPCCSLEGLMTLAGSVGVSVSRAMRQELWQSTRRCQSCGGQFAGNGDCPLCHGTGIIRWDDQLVPASDLRRVVSERSSVGKPSQDGYLWLSTHFPFLADIPSVQAMIRAEVEQDSALALLGYAPDTLSRAGLNGLVIQATKQNPDAARASLRARAILEGSK